MASVHSRYAIISLLAAVLIPATGQADWVERQQPLAHAVYVPKNYDSARKYPLAIVIHGNGWQGNNNSVYKGEFYAQHLSDPKIQAGYPHFIYVPQCPAGQTWVASPWQKGSYSVDTVAASDAMNKLTNTLVGLLTEYSIDRNRIYVTGVSMGGQATWDLLGRNPGMFAAAVPVCGCGDPSKAGLLKDVAIWAFHGMDDPTIPIQSERDIMTNLGTAGMKVRRLVNMDPSETPKDKHIFSEYKMGHDVWNKANGLSRFVVPWMFAQSRQAAPPPQAPAAFATTPAPAPQPPAATTAAPAAEKSYGGIRLHLGMTKAEVMAQIEKTPGSKWYVPELDAPPTGELYKMDKWGLAYRNDSGGGMVTLTFVNEKITGIQGDGDRK